jgi:hypothetical protein
MSNYYKKSNNIFNPKSKDPFKLSRSKIDLFVDCPQCFYLDRRLGISRPPSFPFSLNSAVDALLIKLTPKSLRLKREPITKLSLGGGI